MKTFTYKNICDASIHEMALLLQNRASAIPKFNENINSSNLSDVYFDFLTKLVTSNEAIGVAGYENGVMRGYLIGRAKIDESYDQQIWVPYEGIAVDDTVHEEFIMSLYSEASKLWILNGLFKYYVISTCEGPRYINAFPRLSFAYEQVHGILKLKAFKPFKNGLDINIRNATKDDSELLGKKADIIFSYQNQPPIYAVV